MYPITRESVMAAISSSVAEKAVCWCEGRKKRRRRIVCRLTHLAVDARVIGGLESRMAISAAATRAWNILSWCKRLLTTPEPKTPEPKTMDAVRRLRYKEQHEGREPLADSP